MKRSEWADKWFQQALHDLGAAEAMAREGFYDSCALMCQQAGEKVVKALWIDVRGEDPPKIHWVERLAADLGAPNDIRMDLNALVGDYMASRYPDAARGVPYTLYHLEEAEDRLAKARAVIDWAEAFWEDDNGGD